MPPLTVLPTPKARIHAKPLARTVCKWANCSVKLNKQRKLYVGVLAVALAGLAIDRMVGGGLPGPQGAEASSSLTGDPAGPADRTGAVASAGSLDAPVVADSVVPARTMRTVAAQLSDLAERNRSFSNVASAGDAFAFPALLVEIVKPVKVEQVVAPQAKAAEPTSVAADELKLSSISKQSTEAGVKAALSSVVVVINGQPLQVGKSIKGWKVVDVTDRSVTVENAAKQQAILLLPDATGGLIDRQ